MTSGPAKSFRELEVGDAAEFTVVLTESDHLTFAKLSGDTSPVHTDDAAAKEQGFERKIGYAFHLSSLLSRVYGMHLPGGSSVCMKQESNFPNPWYPGDAITVEARVVRKIESTRMVEIQTEMRRAEGTVVFRGLGLVRLQH